MCRTQGGEGHTCVTRRNRRVTVALRLCHTQGAEGHASLAREGVEGYTCVTLGVTHARRRGSQMSHTRGAGGYTREAPRVADVSHARRRGSQMSHTRGAGGYTCVTREALG
eukprot:8302497-Pyramimonas_sp.AAC.1